METTAQRNSRIANEDAGAHSAFNHAIDFFKGLATYEIMPSRMSGFYVFQKTPHGQLCTDVKTIEEAEAKIEDWKSADNCNGYTRQQLGDLV